jgi:hypothetical protein
VWRRTVHKCSVNLFWREDGEADGGIFCGLVMYCRFTVAFT